MSDDTLGVIVIAAAVVAILALMLAVVLRQPDAYVPTPNTTTELPDARCPTVGVWCGSPNGSPR